MFYLTDTSISKSIRSQSFCLVNLRIKQWSPSCSDKKINLIPLRYPVHVGVILCRDILYMLGSYSAGISCACWGHTLQGYPVHVGVILCKDILCMLGSYSAEITLIDWFKSLFIEKFIFQTCIFYSSFPTKLDFKRGLD